MVEIEGFKNFSNMKRFFIEDEFILTQEMSEKMLSIYEVDALGDCLKELLIKIVEYARECNYSYIYMTSRSDEEIVAALEVGFKISGTASATKILTYYI